MRKLLVVFSTVVLVGCASEDADSPPAELEASCGPVTFESVPPGPDEPPGTLDSAFAYVRGRFPPLDTEAQSALDELVKGLPPLEAAGFERDYQWSIASRTDEQLVLFGQFETPEPMARHVEFVREDGEWTPTTWGTCQVVLHEARP